MKQKIIILVACLAMAWVSSQAQTEFTVVIPSGDTLNFQLTDNGATLIARGGLIPARHIITPNYPNLVGHLVIPETVTYNGTQIPVTAIASQAFLGCPGLTAVTIPSTVTSIGRSAFCCPNLSTVYFNATNCNELGPEYNPDYDLQDNTFTFSTYDSMYTINNAGDTVVISFLDWYLSHGMIIDFSWAGGLLSDYHLIKYDTYAPVTNVIVGDNVRRVPGFFMRNIATLQSITFPESLEEIGEYAFYGTSLSTVTLPTSLKHLGGYSFYGTNLTTLNYNATSAKTFFSNDYYYGISAVFSNVSLINIGNTVDSIPAKLICDSTMISLTIPENVKYVGYRAFLCRSLTTLNYNATSATMNSNTFYYTSDYVYDTIMAPITTLNIGSTVRRIPDNFMKGLSLLTSVVIPDSVRYIGTQAFYGTGLTSVTIPTFVDTIRYEAFSNCSLSVVNYNATNAVYSEGNVFVPSYHFNGGNRIFDVNSQILNIGSNVHSLPYGIFSDMQITSVILPDSLLGIGNGAFTGTNLESINIPDMVTTIGHGAFFGCGSLTSAVIGDDVTTIGSDAFGNCNLHFVTIGESVTSIGSHVFYGLTNPDTIFIRAAVPPTITSNTFEGMPTNAKIRVPCGTLEDYQDAPYWNTFTRISEDPSCYNLITAVPNNAAYGSVTGGGRYSIGNIATLSALPHNGYSFNGWADGSVDNPRMVLVTGDASYTANFASAEAIIVHDTTIVNVEVLVHDTTYVNIEVPVHDTTYVPYPVHDTTYINVEVPVHDTTVVTLIDTVTVTNIDTIAIVVHDTTLVTLTDTLWLTQTDTLWLYDTIIIHDTIVIHDTIFVNPEGIGDVEGTWAKIYQSNGQIVVDGADGQTVTLYDVTGRILATKRDKYAPLHFSIHTSGTYLIKIGTLPARRIVVIR